MGLGLGLAGWRDCVVAGEITGVLGVAGAGTGRAWTVWGDCVVVRGLITGVGTRCCCWGCDWGLG